MTKKLKYAGKWWIPKRYTIYREYHAGMFDYDTEVWTWNAPVYFGFAVINESPNKKKKATLVILLTIYQNIAYHYDTRRTENG